MAEPLVFVNYKRDSPMGETFSGTVDSPLGEVAFTGFTFNQVLTLAGETLQKAPGHRLAMKRKEAPYPMLLPEGVEELLRTDIPAAIEVLTVGHQRIVIGPAKRPPPSQGLRHGSDTLADALGELVYLRRKPRGTGMEIEDPATGRWRALTDNAEGYIFCGRLRLATVVGGDNGTRWATARTETLLALELERYYLPRKWNPLGGWISHGLLATMYETYRKEKSDVANF